ncbi:MAG: helix-hairpin-helix domain-containing protein [Roseovarius sp.]|jgi:Holliday junction resolvasome RuvABC DNA-binding subunit|nr:helix-hairpin-helix domain-containing protein [Roseovarius sp.]
MSELNDIPGVGPAIALGLANIGITTTEHLSKADVATLIQVRGISEARAERFIAVANMVLAAPELPKAAPVNAKKTAETKPSEDKPKSKKGGGKKDKKPKKDKKKDKKKKADKSGSDKKAKKGKKKK